MKIHQIPLPTPFPVGDVNIYLILQEPITLIDTGIKTPESLEALRVGLRKHKISFTDVKRILLTHTHFDHCGLARIIKDESPDVEIFVHDWESGDIFGRDEREENERLLVRAGVPEDAILKINEFYEMSGAFFDVINRDDFSTLRDEMLIEFERETLKVLHTPGHTAGSCSFLRESNRTIIGGDCIIEKLTPNPILTANPLDKTARFHSLGEYMVSLAKIRSFAPTLIYCGHGEVVTDYEELFNRYVRSVNNRQQTVSSLVTSSGVTAWETAKRLFPKAIEDKLNRFLAISETVAHLDYAEQEGKITVEIKDGVEFYRKS